MNQTTTYLPTDHAPTGHAPDPTGDAPATNPLRRMYALARAEVTLLLRNRSALFVALLLPVFMVVTFRSSADQLDLAETGLTANEVVMTGGIVMVLLLVVYLNLVPTYVARREERVLKRLRTGELTDHEILTGSALPAVLLALAQCVMLVVAGAVLLDLSAPARPDLLLVGVLLGSAILALLAALTAAYTKTVESAQVTGMPLLLVSMFGSGVFVPLDIFPDNVAEGLRFLPATPVADLVRGGWLGGMDGAEQLQALGLAVAWTVLAFELVRRQFRWDPRK